MKSIREALIVLFKNMNDNYLEWHVQLEESIEKTIQVIDSIIMQGYFSVIKSTMEYLSNSLYIYIFIVYLYMNYAC